MLPQQVCIRCSLSLCTILRSQPIHLPPQIARDLPGLSGAELANVLNEGALEAVRRDATSISAADIYNAVDRILQVHCAAKTLPAWSLQGCQFSKPGDKHAVTQCSDGRCSCC